MTLRLNHSSPCSFATLLTALGLMRVDGASREHEGARHSSIASGLHERRGGKHGDSRLAHRKHMNVSFEETQDSFDRVDVIVEIEVAVDQRNVARILPVGDVDISVRKK